MTIKHNPDAVAAVRRLANFAASMIRMERNERDSGAQRFMRGMREGFKISAKVAANQFRP